MANARKQLSDLRKELNAIDTVQSEEIDMDAVDRYHKMYFQLVAEHGRDAVQAAMSNYFDSDEWRSDYRKLIQGAMDKMLQQGPIDRVKLENYEYALEQFDREEAKRIAKLESEAANVQ